jgi:uncharacterized membrane protein HdeD (DUF308 family)
MKAPSDLRMVVGLLLVVAGIGAICYVLAFAPKSDPLPPPWVAWCLLFSGPPLIGAGVLHPFQRALLGAFFGLLAMALLIGILFVLFLIHPGNLC